MPSNKIEKSIQTNITLHQKKRATVAERHRLHVFIYFFCLVIEPKSDKFYNLSAVYCHEILHTYAKITYIYPICAPH